MVAPTCFFLKMSIGAGRDRVLGSYRSEVGNVVAEQEHEEKQQRRVGESMFWYGDPMVVNVCANLKQWKIQSHVTFRKLYSSVVSESPSQAERCAQCSLYAHPNWTL
jgi:hypothetical protein